MASMALRMTSSSVSEALSDGRRLNGSLVAYLRCVRHVAQMNENAVARIGILTVSDRASRGEYEDRGGPAVRNYLDEVLTGPWEADTRIVPDEYDQIKQALIEMAEAGCCLVVTTGGTGPAPRDITPEVTEAVCEKLLPGFGEQMRAVSVRYVPTAILSRQLAGVRSNTLFINLPGNPKAIAECLDAVFAAIPDCVDLIGGPCLETNPKRVISYRPRD